MFTYKLRAETDLDVIRLVRENPTKIKNLNFEYLSSINLAVAVTFQSPLSYIDLVKVLGQIEDSHVMVETLASLADYTGKRIEYPF